MRARRALCVCVCTSVSVLRARTRGTCSRGSSRCPRPSRGARRGAGHPRRSAYCACGWICVEHANTQSQWTFTISPPVTMMLHEGRVRVGVMRARAVCVHECECGPSTYFPHWFKMVVTLATSQPGSAARPRAAATISSLCLRGWIWVEHAPIYSIAMDIRNFPVCDDVAKRRNGCVWESCARVMFPCTSVSVVRALTFRSDPRGS